MKFQECEDAKLLREFAEFLMHMITELYDSIDEAWEHFLKYKKQGWNK